MVMGVLSSALDLAKAAVSHDEQGALPEKVLPYYKKVSCFRRTCAMTGAHSYAESTPLQSSRLCCCLKANIGDGHKRP